MTAAERAQLLRERFKVRPFTKSQFGTGMARAGKPSDQPKRVRYVVLPKPTGRGFVSCGPMQSRDVPAWVKTPDEHAKPALSLKRRQGAPVLAKVAAKAKRPKLAKIKLREPWECATFKP